MTRRRTLAHRSGGRPSPVLLTPGPVVSWSTLPASDTRLNIDLIPDIGLPRSVARSSVELGNGSPTFVAGGAGGGYLGHRAGSSCLLRSRRLGFHLELEGGVYPWQGWPRQTFHDSVAGDQGAEARPAGPAVRFGENCRVLAPNS